MIRSCLAASFALALFVSGALAAPGDSPVSPADVQAAIDRAKARLYAFEKNGNWETSAAPSASEHAGSPEGGQWGGHTALAVDALLAAGESPQEARIAPAIQFLLKSEIRGTYALAIRCQVWLQLPHMPEANAAIRRDAAMLLSMMRTDGEAAGMWSYLPEVTKTPYSHSRSQYGVLGLWAADQMNVERTDAAWKMIEDGWISHQDPSGGWAYVAPASDKYPVTPDMTAAGVATLFITQQMLHGDNPAGAKESNAAIEKGLGWLASHANLYASETPYARDYPITTLYTFERAAMASGRKFIGNVDWYDRGAGYLLKEQNAGGSWSARSGGLDETAIPDLCFALLFLSHGRAPIIFNKLQYGEAEAASDGVTPVWNQRPQDVANVTNWIGRQLERTLNWQIVSLTEREQDLCDAPVLYVSGRQPLSCTDAQMQMLRSYVQQGGMILGNAEGGSDAFANSFRKLGTKLFPSYEFRNLPASHPIFTAEQYRAAKWTRKPVVLGLSNGVRELMILAPGADPGKAWQLLQMTARKEAFELASDVILYTADRGAFRLRGEYNTITPDPAATSSKTLHIARLDYPGNADPEPGGWRRVAALMLNEHQIRLDVKHVPVGNGQLDDEKTDRSTIAHLTGTTAVELTADQMTELKTFIAHGGTLLIDAAGGSSDFATWVETKLPAALGASFHDLPPDDPLLIGLPVPTRSLFTEFAGGQIGKANKQYRLRGMEIGGRVAVVFSRYDLTSAIVGQPFDGIVGYTPAAGTALVEQLLTKWSTAAGSPAN